MPLHVSTSSTNRHPAALGAGHMNKYLHTGVPCLPDECWCTATAERPLCNCALARSASQPHAALVVACIVGHQLGGTTRWLARMLQLGQQDSKVVCYRYSAAICHVPTRMLSAWVSHCTLMHDRFHRMKPLATAAMQKQHQSATADGTPSQPSHHSHCSILHQYALHIQLPCHSRFCPMAARQPGCYI